jgi:hypothetical protein
MAEDPAHSTYADVAHRLSVDSDGYHSVCQLFLFTGFFCGYAGYLIEWMICRCTAQLHGVACDELHLTNSACSRPTNSEKPHFMQPCLHKQLALFQMLRAYVRAEC